MKNHTMLMPNLCSTARTGAVWTVTTTEAVVTTATIRVISSRATSSRVTIMARARVVEREKEGAPEAGVVAERAG